MNPGELCENSASTSTVSQSTSRASLLYIDKKTKEREDRTFHTLLSLLKDESKEGIFLSTFLDVLEEKNNS